MDRLNSKQKFNNEYLRSIIIVFIIILTIAQMTFYSLDYLSLSNRIEKYHFTMQNNTSLDSKETDKSNNYLANTYTSGPYKSVIGFDESGKVAFFKINGLESNIKQGIDDNQKSANLINASGNPVLTIGILDQNQNQVLYLQKNENKELSKIDFSSLTKELGIYNRHVMWYIILLTLAVFTFFVILILSNIQNEKIKNNFQKTLQTALADKDRMIIHQSRLASIGELAGDIAHQWKQPLNNLILIISNIEGCYEDRENPELLSALGKEAKKAIKYLSSTADDFRTFIKPDSEMSCFDVSEVVHYAAQMNKDRLTHKNIEMSIMMDGNTHVYGYRSQLLQVILNLISNSVDAIYSKKQENGIISLSLFEEKKYITLYVQDNGGGISQENIANIFKAYFTTKGKNGTGIGLYMSRKIIEEIFKGTLSFENVPGGALFMISIPKFGEQ